MPVIKFMSYLVSHLFFIVLLVCTIINPWLPIYRWTNLLPPAHEWLLLLWFCGNLTTTLSNPPEKAGFGSIKLFNLVIGFAAILVHLFGAVCLPDQLIPYVLFTRNQLLALVLLLSFVELLNFLTFHHLFGPWAVIIQDLMKDMMRFLVIMGIFLVGFSLTVSAIYVPIFEPIQAVDVAQLAQHNQLPAAQQIGAGLALSPSVGLDFQSPLFTFEMLFYSLFGLVEPDFMPPMHSSPAISNVIMKLVFGVYMMITVVVLINLLIAMMSNTYQRIEARSDIEWKFGRAKLIRNMIRTSPTPSPLILLIGVWIDLHKKWRLRQASRQKVEKMAVSAFSRKLNVSESAIHYAQIWMSKTPRLNARRQLEQQQLERQRRASSRATSRSGTSLGSDSNHNMATTTTKTSSNNLTVADAGRSSGIFRSKRATSIGQAPEAGMNFGPGVGGGAGGAGNTPAQGKQIHEVVNWPVVVRKYWENLGIVVERDEDQTGHEGSPGGQSSGPGQGSSNGVAGHNHPSNSLDTADDGQ